MRTLVRLQIEHYIVALGAIGASLCAAMWLVSASYGLNELQLVPSLALLAGFGVAAFALLSAPVAASRAGSAAQSSSASREVAEAVAQGSREIESQVAHALRDLQRLQALLDEAIESLVESFDGLDTLARRQRSSRGRPAVDGDATQTQATIDATADRAAIVAFMYELEQHVEGVAVTLQFHDMATQLAGHTRRRMEQAGQLAAGLHAIAAMPDAPARVSDPAAASRRMTPHQTIANLVAEARRVTQGDPVGRPGVISGAVELF